MINIAMKYSDKTQNIILKQSFNKNRNKYKTEIKMTVLELRNQQQ